MARHVAKKTAELVGLSRRQSVAAVARIEVDKRFIGKGYAAATLEGQAALERARDAGVSLDTTYTAKAFACALARASVGGERVLFWHTLSSCTPEPLLANAPSLPAHLEALFL